MALRNSRFLRPIIPFNNPPSLDRHTALPHNQPSHAGQEAQVKPGEIDQDQAAQRENSDVHSRPDTVQFITPDRVPPSPTPAEPAQAPASSAVVPKQSPTITTAASSEPAVRRSGRTRRMNTRLMGYELGNASLYRRGLVGGGR